VSGDLYTLFGLPRGKGPQFPLDGMMDGSQNRSGCCGEERKFPFLPMPEVEPRSSSSWPSHCTNWAFPSKNNISRLLKYDTCLVDSDQLILLRPSRN